MMALNSLSPLSVNSLLVSSSSTSLTSDSHSKPFSVSCQFNSNRDSSEEKRKSVGSSTVLANAEFRKWGKVASATLAAAVIAFGSDMSALADLNKFEAELRGEFGIGSAAQFGSADLRKAVHVNENFR
ncbi:thylakoid lumenal protein TL20.3, chloroplastic-like [Vigna radiata var. radiata]|nr:thylakoid lumenal protein TL20.3, chloroplastic-like [Vigna radiata var. radiata]